MRRFSNSLLALAASLLVAACTCPTVTQTVGDIEVGVRTDPHPAELGDNRFDFWVSQNGDTAETAQVRWRMFMPGMPMNSDETWITAKQDGKRHRGIGDFSMGGTWQVEVAVTIPDEEPVVVTFPYDIEWKLK
jgi:hypothetical protein